MDHGFYLTELAGAEAFRGETPDGKFGRMIGRNNLSNCRNSRVMRQRHHPVRFDAIGRDHFHRRYCKANHRRNHVPPRQE